MAQPQPDHHECDERSSGIKQRIIRRSPSAGNEGLMKFIGSGVYGGNEERDASPGPPPPRAAGTNGAIQQHEIHKILREVRALPDDVVNVVVLALRQPRNEPAKRRLEK